MNKTMFFTVIMLASISLYGCSNDEQDPVIESKLPSVKSFVWSAAEGAPELLAGLNEFDYDLEGRVTLYSTPAQKTVYSYKGIQCNGVVTNTATGAKWQEQLLTFNNAGRPVSEKSTDFDSGDVASANYEYDEEGRLKKYAFSLNDGRFKNCDLTYDSKTGLLVEVRVGRHDSSEEEAVNLRYVYEYTDRKNPVALYPECIQIVDNEPAFGLTGIDGYVRDLLPDKIHVSWNGVPVQVFSFTYGFSDEGKLTSIQENVSWLDDKGNVEQTIPAIHITDIKY